jgi:DNA-binding response OmpR family regulator
MTKKILVVDDDPQIRESWGKVLRAEGYEVALAANARQGIKIFEVERIDLLVLDLNLPDQSGRDVIGLLTALNPFVPIIIDDLTAGAGVGALIEKPLNVPRLVETVEELLAAPPVAHLKRLAGQVSAARYVPPSDRASLNARSPRRRSNP